MIKYLRSLFTTFLPSSNETKLEYYKTSLYFAGKGDQLLNLGKYEEAIKAYDKVIELNPNDLDFYNNRGAALTLLKKYELAIKEFNRVIKLDPNYSGLYNKGLTLIKLGDYKSAFKAINEFIDLEPTKGKLDPIIV